MPFRSLLRIPSLLILLFAVALTGMSARAATITVNSTADDTDPNDGECTLREAIIAANTNTASGVAAGECAAGSGTDTIEFSIAGPGTHTIQPLSALPALTAPVTIDGTTEPDFAGTPVIEVDGSLAGAAVNGLQLTGGDSTVRGLVINRFSEAGISISSDDNVVERNYVGTNAAGAAASGNGTGVSISAGSGNVIGGTAMGAGNVISGNTGPGVHLSSADFFGSTVQANYIGTNAAGTAKVPNTSDGIYIDGSPRNDILDNVISGNDNNGIYIQGTGAEDNEVSRNYIGTNASDANLGNMANGLLAINSGPQIIGGTYDGLGNCCEGNTIAYNGQNGVGISAAPVISFEKGIISNSIYSNVGLGIDLELDGPTANDPGDGDGSSAANRLQNFPEVSNASYDGGTNQVTLTYFVDTDPANADYALRIEIFLADDDNQEGKTVIHSEYYTEDDYNGASARTAGCGGSPCPVTIMFTPAAPTTAADHIVATATDRNGNTSEFSFAANALPVELASFEASLKGEQVVLAWQTASETNNAGFAVMRSAECETVRLPQEMRSGCSWEEIGFVEGRGTTTAPQTYRFTDAALPFEATALVYRLRQIDFDGAFQYSPEIEVALEAPTAFALEAAYPNPFNPQTTIRYALPTASEVKLTVYDVLGREVAVLLDGRQEAGRHAVVWEAGGRPSGVYLVRLEAGPFSQVQRVMLLK